MARWIVRKRECGFVGTEEIEADFLEYYEGTLVFSDNKHHVLAVRVAGEWFAADRVKDQLELA